MKFLVVEDNLRLSSLISAALKDAGHAVDAALAVDEARHYLAGSLYDLVILDLGLPGEDGVVLLRELHGRDRGPPVLVATARGALNDKIQGLDLGADDYLVKPFHMSELLARCRAILRRPGGAMASEITVGNTVLDTDTHELRIAGRLIEMPPKEINALMLLVRRSGRVVAREGLDELLHDQGQEVSINATEAVISRLRRRLIAADSSINVVTVRGVGYMIEDEDKT
jgi:DNA-binding response OmpR family regulator